MALQDLTPQLRTRLGRMERAVGWFVLLATAVLVFGFGYYIYNTAARKGWFIQKISYSTSLANATGLKQGDPVTLMGFSVGEITKIEANGPFDPYGVTVFFWVKKPYYGYVWSDSMVKAANSGLWGRALELTKGVEGVPTVQEDSGKRAIGLLKREVVDQGVKQATSGGKALSAALNELNAAAKAQPETFYAGLQTAPVYWMTPQESPAVTERLERVVDQVEKALPNFLRLTNELGMILASTASATSNFAAIASNTVPTSDHLAALAKQLRGEGALGAWILPPGGPDQLASTLTNVNSLTGNTDTNLNLLVSELARSLDSLANITSNLNSQVQANTNIVTSLSDIIVHTDDLVQGMKRHWLFRSAFKTPKTNAPPAEKEGALRAPNDPFRTGRPR
jgi:ABC-type transporter Mla subunit MlaD